MIIEIKESAGKKSDAEIVELGTVKSAFTPSYERQENFTSSQAVDYTKNMTRSDITNVELIKLWVLLFAPFNCRTMQPLMLKIFHGAYSTTQ
jgi:hypothetical protein